MNKKLLYNLHNLILIAFYITLSSCSNNSVNNNSEIINNKQKDTLLKTKKVKTTTWQCPLKCEGDRSYSTKNPCPECGEKMNKIVI